MPEGPEIRLAADRIAAVLVGHVIVDAELVPSSLRQYAGRIRGATVTAIDTRGKAMLTRFDNGLTLYSHNQLYGRWYTTKRGQRPATRRSLRVALHTATHSALLYSATDIELLTPEQLEHHSFLTRIGPDILDGGLTASAVARRMQDQRFRRRATGSLYLDQSFLAGVGNYLRSEILFKSRVHPTRRPIELGDAARNRLARETLKLSRRSYETHGITLPSARVARLKAEGIRRAQYRFWVFGRQGLPCRVCGTAIERIAVASRGLFLCPNCQATEAER
jgi:endonuclease-8